MQEKLEKCICYALLRNLDQDAAKKLLAKISHFFLDYFGRLGFWSFLKIEFIFSILRENSTIHEDSCADLWGCFLFDYREAIGNPQDSKLVNPEI